MDKVKTLKVLLIIGSIYYSIGAVAHFFGLTIFPLYVAELYSQYHDTVIALSAIIFSLLLFAIARDPKKNIDTLNIFIIGGVLAVICSIWIVWRMDFTVLGAPAKKMQTIIEMVMLMIYVGLLIYLKPKNK